jgi:hypothetical protein
LKDFSTLDKILDYVREGGLFVNVADIPSYWAYDPYLRRKIDAGQPVFQYVQGGPQVLHPFEAVPLPKALGLRIMGSDPGPRWTLTFDTYSGSSNMTFNRAATIERNVKTHVGVIDLTNQGYITPLFSSYYGEGVFLISLAWMEDNPGRSGEVLTKTIAGLAVGEVLAKKNEQLNAMKSHRFPKIGTFRIAVGSNVD